ncbi:MAG: hypothetical protein ACREQY_01825 [Candidatus Binatia bacterium]
MTVPQLRAPRGAAPITAALFLLALVPRALGHGGLSMENDYCKLRIGTYSMHFSGYQPDSTAEREFCEDIPATGRTVIVLDFLHEKLRRLPVEVRIVRDVGDESNLEAITVFHQPPAVYPKGTLSVEHSFPERGSFVGLVTVADEAPQVSRFPFAVGEGGTRAWLLYGLIGAGALGVGVALFLYSSRQA